MKHPALFFLILPVFLAGCAPAAHLGASSSKVAPVSSASAPALSSGAEQDNYVTFGEVTLGGKTYSVEAVQTEIVPPDTEKYPLCSAVGKFDVIVRDKDGKELHRLNLNDQYGGKTIGFWGVGGKNGDTLTFAADSGKKRCLFGIPVGHGDKPNGNKEGPANLILSLNETGELKVMPVEGGYAFSGEQSNHTVFDRVDPGLASFQLDMFAGAPKYVWDGQRYAKKAAD